MKKYVEEVANQIVNKEWKNAWEIQTTVEKIHKELERGITIMSSNPRPMIEDMHKVLLRAEQQAVNKLIIKEQKQFIETMKKSIDKLLK